MGTADTLQANRLVQQFRRTWPSASFMARLDQDVLDALITGRWGNRFAAGENLIVEGESTTDVFMLITASVKVTAKLDSGTALLAVRIGGDIVGEMAVADGGRRSATVTAARDDTIAIAVPGEEFFSIVNRHPGAAHLLAAELTRKLRAANRRRVDFSACKVPVRVARVLAEMVEHYGQPIERKPSVRTLRVGLSQGELASLVGAKEASVSEALRELRSLRILEWGYKTVTVRDLPALRIAAGQSPDNAAREEIP
jgi:CRP/FNR family cyclic AMP-dependent transcriptional regulator